VARSQTLTVSFPVPLREQLQHHATVEGRTMGEIVRRALTTELARLDTVAVQRRFTRRTDRPTPASRPNNVA
jgi:hypothetical protein